jgi:hypothetical protein
MQIHDLRKESKFYPELKRANNKMWPRIFNDTTAPNQNNQ